MHLGKIITAGLCLIIGIQGQAEDKNVVTIRSDQASDQTTINVTTKADGRIVFENCTKTSKSGEATCFAIGRESGYLPQELEARLSDLKWKSRLRLGAKIAVPVISVVVGGIWGASSGVNHASHSSSPIASGLGFVIGGIRGIAVGGLAGAAGYVLIDVLIDQLTEDYSDRAEALAKGLSGKFVVVPTSIHILIGELSYALSGI